MAPRGRRTAPGSERTFFPWEQGFQTQNSEGSNSFSSPRYGPRTLGILEKNRFFGVFSGPFLVSQQGYRRASMP